ncbi:MAG: TIGR00266 family protein [Planctomycetales bacterium]|nr:TIGR00266 family protein [Planctomycetales bacterium]
MSQLDFEISQRPDFAIVTVRMQPGEKVYSEPAAMASMTPSLTMKAGMKGGWKKALGRMFAGESLIVNTFSAETAPGEVLFAPGIPGDMMHYELDNNSLYLQRGAFLAHSEGVELSAKWQGAKGFFSGQGLVLLKAHGKGDLFFNSFGAILEIDVADEYVVDTGYIVAFEDTLDYKVVVLPGSRPTKTIKNFLFGGEGLVCRFSGQGKVWVQTRYVHPLLSWVYPFRPVKSKD